MQTSDKYEMMQALIRQLECILRDNDAESAWKQFQTACDNFVNYAAFVDITSVYGKENTDAS